MPNATRLDRIETAIHALAALALHLLDRIEAMSDAVSRLNADETALEGEFNAYKAQIATLNDELKDAIVAKEAEGDSSALDEVLGKLDSLVAANKPDASPAPAAPETAPTTASSVAAAQASDTGNAEP